MEVGNVGIESYLLQWEIGDENGRLLWFVGYIGIL